jgi:hypothetical protein
MTPEYLFNSKVLPNILQNKQLAVKTGHDVSESRGPVTAVTASSEVRPYAPRFSEMASGTGRG